ncbi:MAG: hypothetical protein Q8N99_08280 [Nanoarchaeota archaeon]|nr:hypothetical protein [Nanoarchaeota archaeon]
MSNLELTVSREQVTSFLKDEFEDYMIDSQRDRPTWGVDNYSGNILGMTIVRVGNWRKFLPLPEEIRNYFNKVISLGIYFEQSLSEIIGSNPFKDKEKGANEHYDVLVKLVGIYNRGLELEQQNPDIPELKTLNVCLKRQVIITNILFDPEKRDWKFRHLMWSEPQEFMKYIDVIGNNC